MVDERTPRLRLERLLDAARRLADPSHPAGQALRNRLLEAGSLSLPGIVAALELCLETEPAEDDLRQLLATTPRTGRAHVLLSGSVCTAALRAIAIAVASSERVWVRASRRDPALAGALHELVPDLFQLVPELRPEPGDHVWAYGSDETLAVVQRSLPRGVWLHAHGHGFGAALIDSRGITDEEARAIALDTVLFDQQGCLSPRLVYVTGDLAASRRVGTGLAEALAELEVRLPPSPRGDEALAALRRERDARAYAFELYPAGTGWVTVGTEAALPPPCRCLHVVSALDPVAELAKFSRHLTCVSVAAGSATEALRAALPGARLARFGEMQRPPLDGPVDRRRGVLGELLG